MSEEVVADSEVREQPPVSPEEIEAARVALESADARALPSLNTAQTHIAAVHPSGALLKSFPAGVASMRLATGQYSVIFTRNVASDVYSATLGQGFLLLPFPGQIAAVPRNGIPNSILVATYGYNGAAQDRAFYLTVHF